LQRDVVTGCRAGQWGCADDSCLSVRHERHDGPSPLDHWLLL